MVGSRAQKTCEVHSGANRRSREERQGRNESGGWHLRADGRTRVLRDEAPLGVGSTRRLFGARVRPGVDAVHDFDGGAIIDNPKRGVPIPTGSAAHGQRGFRARPPRQRRDRRGKGPREPESVSEGEAKVTRARSLVTRPQGAFGQEVPRRSATHSSERDARPRWASGEGQRSATCLDAGDTALRLRPQWRRRQ